MKVSLPQCIKQNFRLSTKDPGVQRFFVKMQKQSPCGLIFRKFNF